MNEDEVLAVKKGADWLDIVRPGWFRAVNVADLQMSGGCECVLGQVFGDFWTAPYPPTSDRWDDRVEWAREHGFWKHGAHDFIPGSWGQLRALWIEAIEARLFDGEADA